MRLAWFRVNDLTESSPTALTAGLAAQGAGTTIDVITERRAHRFVTDHDRRPYDLCIYDMHNDLDGGFQWAYLYNYPGLLVLHDDSLYESRRATLERLGRGADLDAEFTFDHGHPARRRGPGYAHGQWPMLRAPVLASRLTVVPDEARRSTLVETVPDARVRVVPLCVAEPSPAARHDAPETVTVAATTAGTNAPLVRVVRELAASGVVLSVVRQQDQPADADVVVALGHLEHAFDLGTVIPAMARARVVIVQERETTAVLPALDPQTWRPRGGTPVSGPAVISLDPRDEVHSLLLALRRVASDSALRRGLGEGAKRWWQTHATPELAVPAWASLLQEAAGIAPVPRPEDWPRHLRFERLFDPSAESVFDRAQDARTTPAR